MKRALAALLALVACASSDRVERAPAGDDAVAVSGWGPRLEDWESVRVSTRTVLLSTQRPDLAQVGALTFRGGIELASDDPRFGGLSGLYVDDDRLLAVSDQGHWFAARLVLDDAGVLTGLADPRIAAMRGDDGKPLDDRRQADAEDVTRLPDGRFAVSFEQIHAVRLYDLAKLGPLAAAEKSLGFTGTDKLDGNDSFEAIAAFDDNLLVAAEGFRDRPAPFWIAPLASDVLPAPVGKTRTQDGFGLVALDRLPDGDYLAMERFFAPLIGPRIFLRRVSRAGLSSDPARWEGPPVAELAPPVALDNFEGLAVVPRGGSVRVYIVSDDNFSDIQRTLIYAFDLN